MSPPTRPGQRIRATWEAMETPPDQATRTAAEMAFQHVLPNAMPTLAGVPRRDRQAADRGLGVAVAGVDGCFSGSTAHHPAAARARMERDPKTPTLRWCRPIEFDRSKPPCRKVGTGRKSGRRGRSSSLRKKN